jgi:Ca2+-binding EF-hand superfamily protein
MHRIQQKTKNVGSMIHIAKNPAAEEVVIPPDNEEAMKDDGEGDESGARSKRLAKLPRTSLYSLAPVGSNTFSLRAAQGSAAFSSSTLKGIALGLKGTITFADIGTGQSAGAEHEESQKNEMAVNAMYRRRSSSFRPSHPVASASAGADDDIFGEDSGSDGEASIPTQLNLSKISSLMTKIDTIVSEGAQFWDKSSKARRLLQRHRRKMKSLDSTSLAKMISLERGLANAIRQVFRIVGPDVEMVVQPVKPLTNRVLLPFYKLEDVQNFLEVFNKVDVDFSGDLDPTEWANFFSAMNRAVSYQEAQVMFLKLDTNGDGALSIRELIPLVFDKAKKEQLKLILHYVESEVMKKQHEARRSFTAVELETLFDFYDADVVGFVAVNVIRERIRAMHLPQDAEDYIFKVMQHMEDDEMVNPIEFHRIFEAFLPRPHYLVKKGMLL